MNRGDRLWVRETLNSPWIEGTYEFRCVDREPLGYHSIMRKDGGGRLVVCGCNVRLTDPNPPKRPVLTGSTWRIHENEHQAEALATVDGYDGIGWILTKEIESGELSLWNPAFFHESLSWVSDPPLADEASAEGTP